MLSDLFSLQNVQLPIGVDWTKNRQDKIFCFLKFTLYCTYCLQLPTATTLVSISVQVSFAPIAICLSNIIPLTHSHCNSPFSDHIFPASPDEEML